MVVSGVPKENGICHASEIASMALDLVSVCKTFRIPHKPNTQLRIRAGIHSGMRVGNAIMVAYIQCLRKSQLSATFIVWVTHMLWLLAHSDELLLK